jgi:hypothetical protein
LSPAETLPFIEWFGEEGKRVYGDRIPPQAADKRIVVTKGRSGLAPRSRHGTSRRR